MGGGVDIQVMFWKDKRQFFKTGAKTSALGFFFLFVTYLFLWQTSASTYPSDMFIIIATAIIGSLIITAGLVLMIISLLVREN